MMKVWHTIFRSAYCDVCIFPRCKSDRIFYDSPSTAKIITAEEEKRDMRKKARVVNVFASLDLFAYINISLIYIQVRQSLHMKCHKTHASVKRQD